MRKSLKIILSTVGILVGFIIIDTYYCTFEKDIQSVSWHFKGSKFSCPIDNESDTEVIK